MTKVNVKVISRHGWIPDIPDQRDYPYAMLGSKVTTPLPTSVDLRPLCSPIEDQGNLGSCTANSLAGALEFLEDKDKVKFSDASRLFIYYNERVIERTILSDSGAMIRDGIKTLAKQGFCSEKNWPYNIAKFTKKPNITCYKEALTRLITSYYRLTTLNDMKTCLATGYPFVFGFTVYESFESDVVTKTGVVPMPAANEKTLGGHAVCAVGYDDSTSRFLVRNSWGSNWGINGYFTIPYSYVSNSNLADDFWTIRKGTNI